MFGYSRSRYAGRFHRKSKLIGKSVTGICFMLLGVYFWRSKNMTDSVLSMLAFPLMILGAILFASTGIRLIHFICRKGHSHNHPDGGTTQKD
jgi:hypothetical protein